MSHRSVETADVARWSMTAVMPALVTASFMTLLRALSRPWPFGGGDTGLISYFLIVAVVWAVFLAWMAAHDNTRAVARAGVHERSEVVVVSRAAAGGPVPTDPRLRGAARDVALAQLDGQRRRLPFTAPFIGLIGLGSATAVIAWSPWWIVPAGLSAGFLIYQLTLPRRLERRIDLLCEPMTPDPTRPDDEPIRG